jgi:hypothetical protein
VHVHIDLNKNTVRTGCLPLGLHRFMKHDYIEFLFLLLFENKCLSIYIPYSREQKHVSVSDMSRLEAPASWPSLLV